MAKQTLPVDFQDDLLNVSMGEKRRYRMINNSDGTVSLEDVTVYDRMGSNFGAGQINATNQAVNESFDKNKLIRDLDTINALTEEGYAVDALSVKQITESLTNENSETFNFGVLNGVRGFFTNPSRADDSFIPFSKSKAIVGISEQVMPSSGSVTVTIGNMPENPKVIAFASDVDGNLSLPCNIRIYLGTNMQYGISINTDNSISTNKDVKITIGDNYITFGSRGSWDTGKYIHYIIW